MVAARWRRALEGLDTTVVANADDPLVAYAAGQARRVVWVAAGSLWHEDAYHCPVCDSRITLRARGRQRRRARPGTARAVSPVRRPPRPSSARTSSSPTAASHQIELSVPGRFNRANAAMAAIAARRSASPSARRSPRRAA